MIVWLTGLSGAGKTTVGELLYRKIKARFSATVLLDGDVLREVWADDLGHDIESRLLNAKRLSMLSRMLDLQGINVVACVLSISPLWRRWNRENLSDYYEIKLEPGMDILLERDSKGLYAAAIRGEIDNVVGVDIPYPNDVTHDLAFIGREALVPPDEIARQIFEKIKDRLEADRGD